MYSSDTQYSYKVYTEISIEKVLKVSLRVKIMGERMFLSAVRLISKICDWFPPNPALIIIQSNYI